MNELSESRRKFLKAASLTAGAFFLSSAKVVAESGMSPQSSDTQVSSDSSSADYTLHIKTSPIEIAPNRIISATTYNGQFPGPLLRFKEGRQVTLDVHNDTDVAEQLHWHGQIVPVEVDGAAEEGTPFIPAHGKRRIVFTPRPAGFRFYHTHNRAGANLLTAASGFNGHMIDMGAQGAPCPQQPNLNYDCEGVVVEHLGFTGGVNGIVNTYSEELSYVSDVAFTNMTGVGLTLSVNCSGPPPPSGCKGFSSNSGPYSNISYSGTGACLSITGKNPNEGTNPLRGVHGLTCTTSHNPAVYLDGSNTTLEDITINGLSGSGDGILIGDNASAGAFDDALLNIRGAGVLTTLIHICGLNESGSGNCPSNATAPAVSDLSIVGVTNASCNPGCPGGSPVTIQDDLTNATLSDVNVGMYMLGQPLSVGPTTSGYSRFTTSLNLPTWVTGTMPQSTSSSCPATATGGLYSCTTTTNGCGTGGTKTLWACVSQKWVGIQ
jgi:hypothetical protein